MISQHLRDLLRKIFQEMPSISDLLGLWCSFLGSRRILATAVSADDVDAWMRFKPGANRLDRAIGQQIERLSRFQITDQGSITEAAFEGPIVNANDPVS